MMLKDRKSFVYLRGDQVLIGTMSGPGACVQEDWHLPVFQSSLSALSDGEIGKAVRTAWSRCREIPLHDSNEIQATHMQTLGLGKVTQKKLYANAKRVPVYMKNGVIDINATIQDRVGGYSLLPGISVQLPDDASDESIGGAVREMLYLSQTKY